MSGFIHNEEAGRRDFIALGGLSANDIQYLDSLLHPAGEPHVRARRNWFSRTFGSNGGAYGWRVYLGLLDNPCVGDGSDNDRVPGKEMRFDLLVYAVRCSYCEAKPLERCKVASLKDARQKKGMWAAPHAARHALAQATYYPQAA